jgi:hypothetical protein
MLVMGLIAALATSQTVNSVENAGNFINITLNNRYVQASFSTSGSDRYFRARGYRPDGRKRCYIYIEAIADGRVTAVNMASVRSVSTDRNIVTIAAQSPNQPYELRLRFISYETAARVGHAAKALQDQC